MSWIVDVAGAASKEECLANFMAAGEGQPVPANILLMCEEALAVVPTFAKGDGSEDPDAPPTFYNLSTSGHVNHNGTHGTSYFHVTASNSFGPAEPA